MAVKDVRNVIIKRFQLKIISNVHIVKKNIGMRLAHLVCALNVFNGILTGGKANKFVFMKYSNLPLAPICNRCAILKD
jgi:hypothetical protein